ncbi:hypothetical protein CXB49_07190 [Chromobacterium sp. ATCC 53434]|uniref:hypothetical protein n=1 Tax=Chromobacterium sp. (strain ATCC 53434 / SC 14030) TaxID=2059672 RepID=UPI000C779AF0|nr:hypothetical protein [Chromobacterium sp. ATCC 53434]AUH50603.1 hypothetical protein CXB49_07190 [Chromobacterium sp. ATCC 53434]
MVLSPMVSMAADDSIVTARHRLFAADEGQPAALRRPVSKRPLVIQSGVFALREISCGVLRKPLITLKCLMD